MAQFIHHPIPAFQPLDSRGAAVKCLETAEEILALQPDVLALSMYCWNTTFLTAIARHCKKRRHDLTVIAGGPDTFGEGAYLLRRYEGLDFVMEMGGELPFRRLLQHLFSPQETFLKDVPFLTFRRGGAPTSSKSRETLSCLEDIPSPILGRSLQDLTTQFFTEDQVATVVETSRGCPINCAFCQYPKSLAGKVAYFPLERCLDELAYLRSLGCKVIYFGDGIFTAHPLRAKAILEFFLNTYTDAGLQVELKMDMLPTSLLPLIQELYHQGRLGIGIGVQSRNEETLRRIGRPSDFSKLEKTVATFNGFGQNFRWDLIYGLPGDTFQDLMAGIDYIFNLTGTLEIAIQPLQVLPGTRLRSDPFRQIMDFDESPPYLVLSSDTFTQLDMQRSARFMESFNRWLKPLLPRLRNETGMCLDRPFGQLFDPTFFVENRSRVEECIEVFSRLKHLIRKSCAPFENERLALECVEHAAIHALGGNLNHPGVCAFLRSFDSLKRLEVEGTRFVPVGLSASFASIGAFWFSRDWKLPRGEQASETWIILSDGDTFNLPGKMVEVLLSCPFLGRSGYSIQALRAFLIAKDISWDDYSEEDLTEVVTSLVKAGLLSSYFLQE